MLFSYNMLMKYLLCSLLLSAFSFSVFALEDKQAYICKNISYNKLLFKLGSVLHAQIDSFANERKMLTYAKRRDFVANYFDKEPKEICEMISDSTDELFSESRMVFRMGHSYDGAIDGLHPYGSNESLKCEEISATESHWDKVLSSITEDYQSHFYSLFEIRTEKKTKKSMIPNLLYLDQIIEISIDTTDKIDDKPMRLCKLYISEVKNIIAQR